MRSHWPRVYISGPITKGDRQENYQQALAAHRSLLANNFAVLNPVLTMQIPWEMYVTHDVWLAADLPWVEVADAVLRLPGESVGADRETARARELGIPVYVDIQDLIHDYHKLGERIPPETKTDDEIRAERQKVYGDPLENHRGIAQMWAPVLQPHADAIASGEPVPAHVVALLFVLLKVDRMRLVYHADNYADARNYLQFAEEWQKG